MSKFLIFADPHIHERKEFSFVNFMGLNSRLYEGLLVLENIIRIAEEEGVHDIFCLGDLFELHDRIPNHVLQETREIIGRSPVPFHLLLGNHDFSLEKYPTPQNFYSVPNLDIIHKPGVREIGDETIGFIPFQRDYKRFEEWWNKMVDPVSSYPSVSMILFHQDVPGASYSSGIKVKAEGKLKTKPGIVYIGGHIHKPQWIRVGTEKIHYVGSPYQINFGEEGEEKRVFIFESQGQKIKERKIEGAPKFLTLDFFEEPDERVKGNYVRITGEVPYEDWRSFDKREATKKIEEMGAKSVTWNIKTKRRKRKGKEIISQQDESIIKEFINGLDVKNKKFLLDVGMEVWRESNEG